MNSLEDEKELRELIEEVIEENFLLNIIADGCKRHPAYRGIKRPFTKCKGCWAIYDAARELKDKVEDSEQ